MTTSPNRLRAAHEKVAVGGLVEWLGSVGNRPGNQTTLTIVTNTGPARPADRDIARFGQFQEALVGCRVPVGRDPAARERHQRARVAVVLGNMGSPCRRADDTRCHRFTAVEDFDVNPLGRHAPRGERFLHLGHEAIRPADVDISLSRDADLLEHRSRQVTGRVEVFRHPVAWAWRAVTHIAAAVREREHQPIDLAGEWMMLAIASPVQPPHLPRRASRRQRVQHRQNRRRTDSRAEQHDRPLSRLQDETAARRADVKNIADPDMLPQVGSRRAMGLDLHADSIALPRRGTRERVTTKEWWAAIGPLKAQDNILTCQRHWQRPAIRTLQRQRQNVHALLVDRRHCERAKSWRDRMRSGGRDEPRVAASGRSRFTPQHRCEGRTPSRGQRFDPQGVLQSIARMIGRIQESVDLRDGHPLFRLSRLHDSSPRPHRLPPAPEGRIRAGRWTSAKPASAVRSCGCRRDSRSREAA